MRTFRGGLVLLFLGVAGCAGPRPVGANEAVSEALVQRAYAENGAIHAVSDALDQRLDRMVMARVVMLGQ